MSERRSLRLETERLLLRAPVVDDAPAGVELLADPEVMRFLGGRTVPLKNAADVVGTWLERWETHDAGPFVVERRNALRQRTRGRLGAPERLTEPLA